MGAMGFGLAAGGLSALAGLAGAERQRNQQLAQAAQMEAQAGQYRQQAALERQKGEIEARQIDRRKSLLRTEFTEAQGRNRSLLGAGNVDMTSGSALDVASGNINSFAADMGENAYQRALRLWEADARQKTLNWQADSADSSASYLKNTAGNLGTSLLTSAIQGATGFASAYSMAGGKLSSLFSSSKPQYWDRALQQWTTSRPIH